MLATILSEAQQRLGRIIESLKEELAVIRVGRATPNLVEDIRVSVYETHMAIKELAAIAAVDPTLLTISPWDKEILDNLVSAIRSADLGLNPVVDGQVIKIPVPRLSEERREEMIKKVAEIAEDARVKVKRVRRDKMKSAEDLEGEEGISEDGIFRFKTDLQTAVEEANEKIEELRENKSKELTA